MSKQLLYILFLFSSTLSAQDRTSLSGTITTIDFLPIEAHIWNDTQNSGTISSVNGNFEITAAIKDTLRISSLGYRTIFITLQQKHFETQLTVPLKTAINELEEVAIFQYGFTGNLASDIKKSLPPPRNCLILILRH